MIDTHVHVWRLADGWYAWNTPSLGAVHADADLDQIRTELESAGVDGVILVQAADRADETDHLLRLAARDPAVRGVVGWLDLGDRAELRDQLRRWQDEPWLVGVRQLWHDHADPDELERSSTLAALELVGGAGLPVDVPDAFPRLATALATAVEQAPGTTFVLDHCGKPPFGDALSWSVWEDWFTGVIDRPNVIVKLSGLFGGSGSATPASADELSRVVQLVEQAAPDRVIIGSDWPMVRGRHGYAEIIARTRQLVAGWSDDLQTAALQTTAASVYRRSAQHRPQPSSSSTGRSIMRSRQ